MKFYFRDHEWSKQLDEAVGTPGETLYAALLDRPVFAKMTKICDPYLGIEFNRHVVKEGNAKFLSVLELFNRVLASNDKDLDDERIAKDLYESSPLLAAGILGCENHSTFILKLNRCLKAAGQSFVTNLTSLQDSFKKTYRHKDIAELLERTEVVTQPNLVKSRLFETAYIIDKILDQKRFIATTLLLAHMHVQRFGTRKDEETNSRPLYNQGSVLFTLLTFSYTPAAGIENPTTTGRARFEAASSNDVYYLWKVFGSILGIREQLLPNNHDQGDALWYAFVGSSYSRTTSREHETVKRLVEPFERAVGDKSIWKILDMVSFAATVRFGRVFEESRLHRAVRAVGWSTSSDHAGMTCSTCGTAHGMRVSVVRVWHHCEVCKKVYCPSCAPIPGVGSVGYGTGYGPAAALALGASFVAPVVGTLAVAALGLRVRSCCWQKTTVLT